ncbi:hypothetical protein CYMTET_34752 [Cymbomonas tetramitiformis]|uniref:Uncharacterized protein n=1 Tax=Cymbomonas tetramitiformis TaxID=36881 RepID=A0AAE0KPW6_9CHLO|nr:hypothetical protein CYMTET_34752 [Cymbomonas tetramitiformis]
MHVGEGQGLAKLPDTEEAVLVYIGALPRRGTVPAGSTHPYLSAINNCHKDLGYEGLAKGRSMNDVALSHEHGIFELRKEKGQQQLSSAASRYIDPTAVAEEHMWRYFGWLAGMQQQGR